VAGSGPEVTLIVFCREPLAGHTKTRLIPHLGAANAAKLAGAFIFDALTKCRALAPGKIVIAGSAPDGAQNSRYLRRAARRFGAELIDQGAGSLGARMARSLEPYRAGGAILFGTDTPSLPLRLLGRSLALLRRVPVVIAPSLDGGYYLVGVRGPMPEIFRAIAWGRSNVLSETVARLRRGGTRYALGPAWYDVDRFSDVALLAAHLATYFPRTRTRNGITAGRQRGDAPSPTLPCPATAKVLQRLGLLRAGRYSTTAGAKSTDERLQRHRPQGILRARQARTREFLMPASEARLVLVTADTKRQALSIARRLVDERLAACVNVVGPIRSVYRWRNAVEEEAEFLLLIKTRASLFGRVERRVIELHSYEVPEVLMFAPSGGSAACLGWLLESTASKPLRAKARVTRNSDKLGNSGKLG